MEKNKTIREKAVHINLTAPKASKPKTDEELGYFLAGLIDSDGTINKNTGRITIGFNTNEVSVAYYLKKVLGGGSIYHAKNKFFSAFESSSKKITLKMANLIRNKLKHADKIKQFNERLVPKYPIELTDEPKDLTPPDLFSNHWLAGFLSGDGCLAIGFKKCKNNIYLFMEICISQKSDNLLKLIKER
jgi:hypothetical protein